VEEAMSKKRVDRSDDPHLASVRKKTAMLRDKLKGVFQGYKTGLLAWGAGGSGKSWTVEDEARLTGVVLRRSTGVLTPRALYEQLRRHPMDIHLIEDNEQLLTKDEAVTVLREATWTVERDDNLRDDGRFPDRPVTWGRCGDPNRFIFSGGIVITQNQKPPANSRVDALLTRLRPFELAVTDAELLTLARHLAATAPPRIMGYQMSSDECVEVLMFLAGEAANVGHPIDMRLVKQAYEEYAQFQNGDSHVHWEDHVRALVAQGPPRRFSHPVDLSGSTRAEVQERDRDIVRKILDETRDGDTREQLRLWRERTGKAKSMFFVRRNEVQQLDG
jgi:hypothetical protein